MPKPLNESSNSNQSQTPCEFNNRKFGFFSKFGSAAIAVGSLATALSIAVPSVGAYVGETVTSAFGISPATESVTDNQPTAPKTGTTSEAAILGGQAASSGSTSAATAPTAVISTNALTGAGCSRPKPGNQPSCVTDFNNRGNYPSSDQPSNNSTGNKDTGSSCTSGLSFNRCRQCF